MIRSEDVERLEKTRPKKERRSYSKKRKKSKFSRPPARFDPNDYEMKEWMALGLSEKQSRVVVSFLERGISSNQALEKIYVLPEELYELIKDSTYYDRAEQIKDSSDGSFSADPVEKVLLELNGASKQELISLYGIGDFYARQIIRYREELGGFYVIEQLLEVWKMRLETYEKLLPQVRIDPSLLKKMDINQLGIEELRKHPYLDYYQSNSIVKMREQRQGFKHIEELLESELIDEEQFERLLPYLKLVE